MKKSFLLVVIAAVLAIVLVACGEDDAPAAQIIEVPGAPIIVEKEVIREVPVEVVVEKEVIREVKIPGETVIVEKIVEVVAPTTFGEAPMLAQLVAAGQLPPVADRLPDEPLVIPVFDEIGKYGGTIRRGFLGPGDVSCNTGRFNGGAALRWNTSGSDLIPYVAESVAVANESGSEWTVKLRKGMKWSDGSPFTADDWVFSANDVWANDEIHPGKRPWYKGPDPANPVQVTKVDDATVKFTYPGPFWIFPKVMQHSCATIKQPYLPKDYLSQFMPSFNPDSEANAKAAGFDGWGQYYLNREDLRDNIDRPSARPWLFQNTRGDSTIILERNAYFFAVDRDGNQLPYIDRVRFGLVETPEVLMLKAVQGEIDFQSRHIQLTNFSVLKQNEEKGGYRVVLAPQYGGNDAMININHSFDGPEKVLLRNTEFRLALSAAIDREFLLKTSFLGLGNLRNILPPLGHPHHPGPKFERLNNIYDPDLANEILDRVMGSRDGEGFRTMPDGSKFTFRLSATSAFGAWPDVAEQTARMWSDVGVRTEPDIAERSLMENRNNANENMGYIWNSGGTTDMFARDQDAVPRGSAGWAPFYSLWYDTGGEKGIEPPDDVKNLADMYNRALSLPPEESSKVAKAIWQWHAENQVIIGTIGESPMVQGVTVVNANLGNVPETWGNDILFNTPWPSFPIQFYFKE